MASIVVAQTGEAAHVSSEHKHHPFWNNYLQRIEPDGTSQQPSLNRNIDDIDLAADVYRLVGQDSGLYLLGCPIVCKFSQVIPSTPNEKSVYLRNMQQNCPKEICTSCTPRRLSIPRVLTSSGFDKLPWRDKLWSASCLARLKPAAQLGTFTFVHVRFSFGFEF